LKIRSVRAITVDVPMARPIVMGPITYASREYVIAEVTTDEGLSGIGFGMSRNAPVAAVIDRNITPLLVGQDPRDTEFLWHRVYDANLIIGQRGIFMRALSAVDIALWDVKAKALGVPLWRLLGGYRTRVPAQVAGGYPNDDVTLDDLASEVADYAARGFRIIKIAAGTLAEDTARLRASRAAAPDTPLSYDAHWAWRDLLEVLPAVRSWESLELDCLEDPFPSDLSGHITNLRAATRIPLALGEDYVGRWSFNDLLRSGLADIVRVDATTIGGISEVVKVIGMASAYGLPVSPHVFPEIHVHVGAAFQNVRAVEMTDPARDYETLHKLFSTWVCLDGGDLVAPEAPGLGVELDWKAVDAYRTA
jgi:D-arabinonate dehydratase